MRRQRKVSWKEDAKEGLNFPSRSCGDDWTEIVKTCIKYEMHEYETPSEKDITSKDA